MSGHNAGTTHQRHQTHAAAVLVAATVVAQPRRQHFGPKLEKAVNKAWEKPTPAERQQCGAAWPGARLMHVSPAWFTQAFASLGIRQVRHAPQRPVLFCCVVALRWRRCSAMEASASASSVCSPTLLPHSARVGQQGEGAHTLGTVLLSILPRGQAPQLRFQAPQLGRQAWRLAPTARRGASAEQEEQQRVFAHTLPVPSAPTLLPDGVTDHTCCGAVPAPERGPSRRSSVGTG